jgi:hypothetical protein
MIILDYVLHSFSYSVPLFVLEFSYSGHLLGGDGDHLTLILGLGSEIVLDFCGESIRPQHKFMKILFYIHMYNLKWLGVQTQTRLAHAHCVKMRSKLKPLE